MTGLFSTTQQPDYASLKLTEVAEQEPEALYRTEAATPFEQEAPRYRAWGFGVTLNSGLRICYGL